MPVSSTSRQIETRQDGHDLTDSSGAERRLGRVLAAAERGAWSASASFPPQPANVARARRLTRTALAAWGAAHVSDSAELLMSELVTNALRYGRGAVSIALTLTDGMLQISVSDFGRGVPTLRVAAEDETTGRGLALVTALCARWSVTTRLNGKTVSCWLELT